MVTPRGWQAIYGDFIVEDNVLKYQGSLFTDPKTSTQGPRFGMAMSDVLFSGGTITMTVAYESAPVIPGASFLIARDPKDNSYLAAGLEGQYAPTGDIARFAITVDYTQAGGGIRTLATTAWVKHKNTDSLRLKVKQVGSLLDLYANDVLLLRHVLDFQVPSTQCGVFCASASMVRITDYVVDTRPRTAFVIMEFSPPFENLFAEVIKPVADKCGFAAEKADDLTHPGLIIADVIQKVREADMVIADITPMNANVYYEIGYAHAIGKPTILLAQRGKVLPFDVSGFRTLFYDNTIAGKSHIERELRKYIEAVSGDSQVR